MVLIGELATPHPIEVLPQTPVFEAARRMADLGVGDVIVTDETSGSVVGMVTDRDLAVRVIARNLDPVATTVGDVCTPDVTTLPATADIAAAQRLMRDHRVRRLPVVDDDGRPAGIVSISDLAASGLVDGDELSDVMRSLGTRRRDSWSTDARTR